MSSFTKALVGLALASTIGASNSTAKVEVQSVSSPAHDSRMIAYVGNWQDCPSAQTTAAYSHIVIAFAVTYRWNAAKNQCNEQCNIDVPPVCGNNNNPALIKEWQDAGKKVILSFGGAGMGGSWGGDKNNCWDYCFGKEQHVISQLTDIVTSMNLDGVDIDYEYFYDNNQPNAPGRGFTQGPAALKFLKEVTVGLKQAMPMGEVTHAPMDPDLVPGSGYYRVLQETASSLDFLMPQFYNGHTRAVTDGFDGPANAGKWTALSQYKDLTDNMFGGDPTKVVFGFCINDCSGTGSNANTAQAVQVMKDVNKYYSCNGGAFFWVANDDQAGAWSSAVRDVSRSQEGCSGSVTPPKPSPKASPGMGLVCTAVASSSHCMADSWCAAHCENRQTGMVNPACTTQGGNLCECKTAVVNPVTPNPTCQVGGWSQWSACSVTCGTGSQSRTRQVTPSGCDAASQTQACTKPTCQTPPVDGDACVAGKAYTGGKQCVQDGVKYQAKWWVNTLPPGQAWKVV